MDVQEQVTRILVVDDHPVSMRGICAIIDGEPDMEVCAMATSPAEAMRLFIKRTPDLAVVDLRLGDLSGLDLVRDLLIQQPGFPMLVFSMYEDTLYAERAIRAGARGYVMKHEPPDVVLAAIRSIHEGRLHLREGLAPQILSRVLVDKASPPKDPLTALTDRELQVFHAMADGQGRKEIADDIHVSVKTLDGYRRNMVNKLGLSTATQLAQLAARYDETGEL
ncbi:MAG: response regulator transcription factor [Verrucomicrobia bacterium]|jgi:DNA-binding NarL/FixJ family response regulator|nr:response regulator transcription factor [Verrucomicrobiota bacterium]MBT7064789.1 response regulator transcription factor [Verrucomicrobiota bacterium]MBT7700575.1 response regulator transcription factor [Verrucomicrobiota bacterium]